MRTLLLSALLAVGCTPIYKYVTHSGKSPEGRMCEMQAQRARDYCKKGCSDDECARCEAEYREAFVTCGGSIDKICIRHCSSAEDKKLVHQTQD